MVLDAAALPWVLLQAGLWFLAQRAAVALWSPPAVWGALAAQAAASLLFWIFLAVAVPADAGSLAPQWAGTALAALVLNAVSAWVLSRKR